VLVIYTCVGADALLEDSAGDTALTISAWHGRAEVVRSLLPVSCIEHRELDEGQTSSVNHGCRTLWDRWDTSPNMENTITIVPFPIFEAEQ